ncbi:hypothetical protein CYMTET_12222 [Cymbomonas tetramitiformis]|uniref:ABC transporter domain-containing protein n=1 Tax=Cymbomonas tetramitiformis TaxID=36881 RepID=A0AAE0LCA1_9CHLO|nr:hypothetical protein CYMTET_12222 [Cymbomonas tetramitiformis]
MRMRSSYVQQNDLFPLILTVQEHLNFHSRLRLPTWISTRRDNKVKRILTTLDISGCAAQRVGSLSGGQKKRLAIAEELILDPIIWYLDEPTSGLDASMALTVVKVMEDLAR